MSFNKLGSTALVAASSVLIALFFRQKDTTVTHVAREMVLPTSDIESSELPKPLDIDGYNDLRGLIPPYNSNPALYFEYMFPGDTFHCHPSPDPCAEEVIKRDKSWMEGVPDKCRDGYEEAGVYTTNKGVKIEENEFVKKALTHLGWYKDGSYPKMCNQYFFLKIRACVPKGSSCFPNGDLSIKTYVYYNLVARVYGLLGAYTGRGAFKKEEETYRGKKLSVDYYQGPFYPGQEYHFGGRDQIDKEHNQWRFEEISPGSKAYRLINRWTGQYMGSGSKDHNSFYRDKVGKSSLYSHEAVTVTIDEFCDRLGTVNLYALNNGAFRRGMTTHLFFTSNKPHKFIERTTTCDLYPQCREDEWYDRTSRYRCFPGWRRYVCRSNAPEQEYIYKDPLKFWIREVTSHVEPQHSATKDPKPVPINIDNNNSANRVALEGIAPKFAVERASNVFDAAMQFYFDNPEWRPFGRTVPKNVSFRSAGNAIIAAQRMRGTLGTPRKSVSGVSRTLKFASLGGPGLAIFTGFLTSYFDFEAAKATEKRFRAIEQQLRETVTYIDENIKSVSWDTAKLNYGKLYRDTYITYQGKIADIRHHAFKSLNREFVYSKQEGRAKDWINELGRMKGDFEKAQDLSLDFTALEEYKVADYYMYTYPTIVVSYIQLIEEIVCLKALLGTGLINPTCEEHVNYEFGEFTNTIDEMRKELKKLENIVTAHRISETRLNNKTVPKYITEPNHCPIPMSSTPSTIAPTESNDVVTKSAPPSPQVGEIGIPPSITQPKDILQTTQSEESPYTNGDVSIQNCLPSIIFKFTFHFRKVEEGSWDNPLLEVPSNDVTTYERVLQLRRDEVAWTFRNFGKYSLDVLYNAIDNCRSNIVGTCVKLQTNSSYQNEFIEFSKQEQLYAYDEEWETCS